jgi:simple sugar transport system ATP-binding protein
VFISHKLAEVAEICDEVTVLRDGAVVGGLDIPAEARRPGVARSQLDQELARLMVGRPLPQLPVRARTETPVVMTLHGAGDGQRLGPVDLHVCAGEILGIAGVEGNGQTELVELLVGVRPCRTGTLELDGDDITGSDVAARLRAGIAHIAEDRHAAAVAVDMPLTENCLLGYQQQAPYVRGRWRLSRPDIVALTRAIVVRQRVRTPSLQARVADLSGGNQQKLVVGRELHRKPRLMIAAQPTRGLDIGATAFVHSELLTLRDQGCAVVLVSLDLTEVMALADRVVVMHSGAIAGSGRPDELDAETLGRWMTGAMVAS